MELVQYIQLVRRWLWLLILASFVGGSISYIIHARQPQLYRAQSLIAIGGFIQSSNPSTDEIYTGYELTETYAHLVRTYDVLDATVNALESSLEPSGLNGMLTTSIVPGTALLQLRITSTDPILSTDLANELARQLIIASPSNLTPEQLTQVELLNEQVASLAKEISDLRGQVSTLDALLSAGDLLVAQREKLENSRITLMNQVNLTSSNIAQFTYTIATLQERSNSVEIVDIARIPEYSLGKNVRSSTILGAITAGALAFGLILLFEYLNDTFHNSEEVSQTLKLPMLGVISRYGKKNVPNHENLLVNDSSSLILEEFRILRTNLLLSNEDSAGIYLITSALPSEGKSMITANLAISMAKAGMRVLLIDADLRRPHIHNLLELDYAPGLTSMLTMVPSKSDQTIEGEDIDLGETGPIQAQIERIQGTQQQTYAPSSWRKVMQATAFDNLQVIPGGNIVENPTELLGSTLMKHWLQIIRNEANFDIILIDTSPSFFPDASVIASSLEATVLFVIEAARTRRGSAVRMIQRFEQFNAKIGGVILNRANPREERYDGYDYYYTYYRSEPQQPSQEFDG